MAYTPNPVTFDGTNDNLLRGGALSGAVDGKNGTMSLWFRQDAGGHGTVRSVLDAQANRVQAQLNASNQMIMRLRSVAGADVCIQSFIAMTDTRWHHVIMTTSGTAAHSARDNVVTTAPTFSDTDIDWTLTNFSVGSTIAAASRFFGDLADVWMDAVYFDLTVTDNLRKFIQDNGYPVDLGSDGSGPTGSAPLVFFSGKTSEWHQNKGTGGGYTLTGELTNGTEPLPGGHRYFFGP
jgi:Concanavalin A-like lectin/glucanases superfamily